MASLLDLPIEIQRRIFRGCSRELKGTCRHFYAMYNELFYQQLIEEMGSGVVYTIGVHAISHIVKYVRSFDYWRGTQRRMVAKVLSLPEYDELQTTNKTPFEAINCTYVRDSWVLIYSLFKNRRLFVEYTDYQVDEPMNYIYRHILQINKTYLLHYHKKIKLSPDIYNLSCGIIIKNALGLGTIKFQVVDQRTGEPLLTYYPPTNINDIIPKERFSLLDLGNFEVARSQGSPEDDDKLVEVDIVMEETGLYIKSGFSMCFIDVNAYPEPLKRETVSGAKVEDSRWLFWTVDNQDPTPDKVINLLLRNCYKAINNGLNLSHSSANYNFKRVGSYAESMYHQGIDAQRPANLPELDENDEFAVEDVPEPEFDTVDNVDDYNREFYSRYNDEGALITKSVKFNTVVDQREHDHDVLLRARQREERLARMTPSERDETLVYLANSPLKWKLPTLFEL